MFCYVEGVKRRRKKEKGGEKTKIKLIEITTVKNKFHEGHILPFLLLLCMTASYSPPLVSDTIFEYPFSKQAAD